MVVLHSGEDFKVESYTCLRQALWRHDTHHNDIMDNDTQHNNMMDNDTQHNDIMDNDIKVNDSQHNNIRIMTLSITTL
jgi:hypothetical protein